jgi:hypothetical protein
LLLGAKLKVAWFMVLSSMSSGSEASLVVHKLTR